MRNVFRGLALLFCNHGDAQSPQPRPRLTAAYQLDGAEAFKNPTLYATVLILGFAHNTLFSRIDPDLMIVEIPVYSARYAGDAAVAVIHRFAEKVPSCSGKHRDQWTEIGEIDRVSV